MEVEYKPNFEEQLNRYSFCFTCEHCSNYNAPENQCHHGYPNELHLLDYYLTDDRPAAILFCKDFDLA